MMCGYTADDVFAAFAHFFNGLCGRAILEADFQAVREAGVQR
jgi:hypothetical protein